MQKTSSIFSNTREDFLKIFAFTFLAFGLSFYSKLLISNYVILGTVFLLDAGHVYSTMIEVYADPTQVRQPYVWIVTLGSLFLNIFVLSFFYNQFFYFIFYFTVFHNMRQGLGVTLLYKRGDAQSISLYKIGYYFLTVFPFILFHFRPRAEIHRLTDAIIRPIELNNFISELSMSMIFKWGVVLYLLGIVIFFSLIVLRKQYKGLASQLFFFAIYAYAFLISNDEFRSYLIFITSHAIPYFFLMHKRIVKSHSVLWIKKYAYSLLVVFFVFGGVMDFYQNYIAEYFEEVDVLARALLTTPLIAHFIFDAILWKRDNERFKQFLNNEIAY